MTDKLYEQASNNYKDATKALRDSAANDGVKIKQDEIMYQCSLTFGTVPDEGFGECCYGEERKLYREALSSVLGKVSLSERAFRAKRKSGECRLEVIASGPHRGVAEAVEEGKSAEGEELKPEGCAYMESGRKLTDLF